VEIVKKSVTIKIFNYLSNGCEVIRINVIYFILYFWVIP